MTRWNNDEVDRLKDLYESVDVSRKEIAKRLQRTESSVTNKAHLLQLKKIRINLVRPNTSPSVALSYVLGTLLGDGYVYLKQYLIGLGVKAEEFADAYFHALSKIGLHPNKYVRPDDGRFVVTAKSKLFCEWFLKLSLKDIEKLLLTNKALIYAFLRGFFDSDGTINRNAPFIAFYNSNKALLRLVQRLLKEVGFESSFHQHHRKNCFGRKPMYVSYLKGGKQAIKDFQDYVEPTIPSKRWWET